MQKLITACFFAVFTVCAHGASVDERMDAERSALIQKLNPSHLRDDTGTSATFVRIRGAKLDAVRSDAVRSNPKDVARSVVSRLKPVLGEFVGEVSIVANKTSDTGEREIEFVQAIDGVKVVNRSSIRIAASGEVTEVDASFLNADSVPELVVGEASAIGVAKQAVMSKFALTPKAFVGPTGHIPESKTRLEYYIYSPNSAVLRWRIQVQVFETGRGYGMHDVHVNATTSEARIPNFSRSFAVSVCEELGGANGSASAIEVPEVVCADQDLNAGPPIGNMIGWYQVNEVYADDVCVGSTADCNDPTFKTARDVLDDFSDWIDSKTGDCCNGFPDLHVYTNDTHSSMDPQGPKYLPRDGTHGVIYIPHKSDNITSIYKANVDLGQVDDILTHEAVHHIEAELNPILLFTGQSDIVGGAVSEGFADALGALWSRSNGESKWKTWRRGEDGLKTPRDLRQAKTFDDIIGEHGLAHVNSLVFGNLIYRLKQEGATTNDLVKVIVGTIDDIQRKMTPDGFDFTVIEVLSKMASHANQNTIDAMETVFDDMGVDVPEPPAGGGGSGGGISNPDNFNCQGYWDRRQRCREGLPGVPVWSPGTGDDGE